MVEYGFPTEEDNAEWAGLHEDAVKFSDSKGLIKLEIGARYTVWPGWTYSDIVKEPHIDVQWDLNNRPSPWKDNSVGVLKAHHVLEHLEGVISAMQECWRILCTNGYFLLQVPSTRD